MALSNISSSIKASVLNRPTFCESSAIGHLLVPEVVDRAEVLRFQDVSAGSVAALTPLSFTFTYKHGPVGLLP